MTHDATKELEHIRAFERITDAYVALDADWRYTYVNAAAGRMFGRDPDELIGKHIWTEFPEGVGQPFHLAYKRAMAEQRPLAIEEYFEPWGRWFENRIYPSPQGLTIYFSDVTERRRNERFDAGQREILADIAEHRPLAESLERIARLHEDLNPGALCSILLTDADGTHLVHGAAPSLPAEYNSAMDGQEIGDNRGSCGTAMSRGERVIVADIAHHPYWAAYKDLALAHGLRACWSTPVLDSRGGVIGSFAVYYRKVRVPDADELASIDRMLSVTAIAIESDLLIHRLRERELFFDLSAEIFCIFDTKTERIVQANPTFSRLTGFSEDELKSRHYLEFVHPEDQAMVARALQALLADRHRTQGATYRFRCKDGSYRWLAWEGIVEPDGMAFAVAHDVTGQRLAEAALVHAASHDAVTTLPHHLGLERAVDAMLQDADTPVWMLLINVDRFKAVNESMGHGIGDEVLQILAQRLQATVGAHGHIARLPGDTFVVALASPATGDVMALAERLRLDVAKPIESSGYRLLLTASIGVSHSPEHGRTEQELLRRAEAAMGRAKRHGCDMVCEFSVEQMRELEDRLSLGGLLRRAIERGEMSLHYQPQHHATSRELNGFEALLRWQSGVLGDISPTRFIPVAEALGLMPEIGAWVVNEASRQARAWLDQGYREFQISVNVSAQELQRPGLIGHVSDALQRHALPGEMLCFELTESSLMENVGRAGAALIELKSLGVQLSLDDFGTGYSSLAYLKQFPIDKLKIDQSFIRGLPADGDDVAIARSIVAMGHQLRMAVSAEGVETREQATFLNAIGCDELQGYFLGRPCAPLGAENCFELCALVW